MASSADARPAVIFFDCDDCLYKNDWKVANLLTAKIESFCSERLQMREGYAYELYKKWGTCLRGMQGGHPRRRHGRGVPRVQPRRPAPRTHRT